MRFGEFRNKNNVLPIFSLNDIRKLDPNFYRRQLMDWMDRGYIRSFVGEYYYNPENDVDEVFLFVGANAIYAPSYISLESALAYYQVIPESVLGVTSISSRKTKQFDSQWGIFSYRSVKPLYMFGYEVIATERRWKYTIARLEKAILDFLYLNPHIDTIEDFEGLRWDRSALAGMRNNHLFLDYLEIFGKRTLEKRVEVLWRYLNA
jgi:predicted transcriptional regulator of viral defense system